MLEAYSPLGTGRHLDSDAVVRVAERLDRTPAQVLLRWCIERDVPVIPKSNRRERIIENGALFDFRRKTFTRKLHRINTNVHQDFRALRRAQSHGVMGAREMRDDAVARREQLA